MKLTDKLGYDERVLWTGYKSYKVSVLESIFNRMLPVALLWAIVDFSVMGTSLTSVSMYGSYENFAVIPFFALHLMPVWTYLFGVITSGMQARNTVYMITNKNIYIQSGAFQVTTKVKSIYDIHQITVKQTVFDQMFDTGDVVIECYHSYNTTQNADRMSLDNLEDYEYVFRLLNQAQTGTLR